MTKKTFTLLELVIVLLILGALTALSVSQYMGSQKLSKMRVFEANVNEIVKALSVYRSNQVLYGNLAGAYPTSLSDPQLSALFNQEPKNPYTNKSMLSNNPADTGIQYVSDGLSYKLCIVQQDVEDVNNNGVVEEVLPLSTKTACIGNTQTSVGVTFARNSVAYASNGMQVAVNQPRFEQGKFGKAIMIEERTTNLFTNPGWLDGTLMGWANYSNGNATGIRTVELDSKYGYKLKLEQTGGQPSDRFGIFQGKTWSASGSSLTISVYFKVVSAEEGAKLRLYTDFRNPSDTPYFGRGASVDLKTFEVTPVHYGKASVQALEDGWYYFTCTPSETDNSTGPIYFWIEGGNAQIYLAWSHVEAKPYATSFIDSTRAAETLTIPTAGVLNPQEGTIESWVYVNGVARRNIDWPTVALIRKGSSAANWIWLYHRPNGQWTLQIRKEDGTVTSGGAFSDSLTPDGWHYFAIRWNAQAGTADLFHNGVKRVSLTGVVFPAEYDRINIGYREGGNDYLNSLIDDLRISSRARTDAEIQAAYRNNQSLPVDAWTTLKLDFNGDLSTQSGVIP